MAPEYQGSITSPFTFINEILGKLSQSKVGDVIAETALD